MSLFDFAANPLWLNAVIFTIAAVVIWIAGTKLEHSVDSLAEITGYGQAFLGMVLLAAATSLPEIATTTTATLAGNTTLAVHNLVGSIVMQTAILAVADAVSGRHALTHTSPHFVLLLQAVGLIFVQSVALMGMVASAPLQQYLAAQGINLAVSAWAVLLFGLYLLMMYATYRAQSRPRWQILDEHVPESSDDALLQEKGDAAEASLQKTLVVFGIAALVVLAAGWTVASTADALATQTGLGSTFVGFTLLAIATALPELSTTVSAARHGRYETAFSNIFGSNALMIALLALVALLGGGEALMQNMPASAQFATALGILVTCIYLWGLLEREDRSLWRLGWDSIAVVFFAVGGTAVMFFLK